MYNPVNEGLVALGEKYGINDFILRYAICLLGSFPLNAILKRLPDERINLKCGYILGVSLFLLFGVLDLYKGFQTLFISTIFTYVTSRFYRSSFMPHLNFMFVMGHLAFSHLHAQFFNEQNGDTIDITGAQMVLVMKLTSFAWSYYDGSYTKDEDFAELSEYQKSRAIRKHPSLLKFLAYAYFYPTLLTGPSFDFADFDSWLNCEMFRDLPESRKPKRRLDPTKRRQIPKNGRLAFWKALQGLMWLYLSLSAPKYVNTDYMLDKSKFEQRSFFFRINYMYILGTTFRFKYYAAWTIAEAACILCGLGYNGYDSKTQTIKWNRVQNIDIWHVEMAQSTRETFEAWNMNTNKWLKNYVYLRVAKKGKKPGFRSTLFTFLTSAFWHGTRPGYYLTFATGALFQTCGRIYRRNFRPMFLSKDGKTPLPYKWVYDAICFYVIKLAFGYLVQPFIILDLGKSLQAWKSVYFYIHIGVAASLFLFRGPYARKIIKFCQSKQPKEVALNEQRKLEKEISASSASLGGILSDKLAYEKKNGSELQMNLGIPEIDLSNIDDAKKEWNEFCEDYYDWRDKNGLAIEEENLAKAFKRFQREFASRSDDKKTEERRMSFSDYSPHPFAGDKKQD
ncbi:hypothetical protein HG535_0G02510 [Zygotorulaspora mrakii]|uniref:Uncharacterized protein n=1 Tax=Zygotorulaspora mrakii TaxID=42260 RepID=A0A7H9B718_ZYGMR|nr:uncharacterized protein HG535_0G02510 [Zygotorulaspora mrakii]QLG74367.1 hypothetical protein HG535_0G02510 [Zygotorulaspora mrakii]